MFDPRFGLHNWYNPSRGGDLGFSAEGKRRTDRGPRATATRPLEGTPEVMARINPPMLPRARQIARAVHRHQRDLAGKPYLAHVYRVMRAVPERLRVVACLHDVVEDGGAKWTLDRLEAEGFEAWVLAALDALTRRKAETYTGYILRLARNPDALEVKLEDLADNLDPRRPIPDSLRKRYEGARGLLLSLGALGAAAR